jgi:exonuclease SbcC
MRLKGLAVEGFRGFADQQIFDLDADAIIVVGANGSGKTSLFDAILWALTGSIQRLSDREEDVVSRYSPTGEARVELTIDRDGHTMTVVRRFAGDDHLTINDSEFGGSSGDAADTLLIDLLWPEGRGALEPKAALSRSMTRAIYLQQDVVREFIDSDDELARFGVVSELVGVGRITELLRALETSRRAWSAATTRLTKEIEPIQSQVTALESRIGRLSSEDVAVPDKELNRWRDSIQRYVTQSDGDELSKPTSESVDRLISVIQALQRQDERRIADLERLIAHLRSPRPQVLESVPIQSRIDELRGLVSIASDQLRIAQESIASERRRQAELRDSAESLQALAQLALQHLDERCPVCGQSYDIEETRNRLEALLGESVEEIDPAQPDSVSAVAAQLEHLQRELADSEAQLRAAQASELDAERWNQLAQSLAGEQGLINSGDVLSAAVAKLSEVQERLGNLQRLRGEGESLSLQLARAAEVVQRSDVMAELVAIQRGLAQREAEIGHRMATYELASDLVSAIRGASNALVSEELALIGPLLQRIYASVDPHPSFRAAQFLTGEYRGKGTVWTTLSDELENKTITEPSIVLSSSQLNVLAVSTFLALNLAVRSLPLQLVALDDPLQSLDTVNLLGLADLLRRVRSNRQIFVSTHDERLAQLLARKLRPTGASPSRTRLIRLDAWSRRGPFVDASDVPPDTVPLKLVASA